MKIVRLLTLLFAGSSLLSAQTYTPQQITFTGAPSYKSSALVAGTGLVAGKPISKEQIEQGMQKLADTGLFADMRYNVDSHALTFALTPQPDSAMLTAVYSNFVFFDTPQLTSLVQARVPLFTGKIPNNGGSSKPSRTPLSPSSSTKASTRTSNRSSAKPRMVVSQSATPSSTRPFRSGCSPSPPSLPPRRSASPSFAASTPATSTRTPPTPPSATASPTPTATSAFLTSPSTPPPMPPQSSNPPALPSTSPPKQTKAAATP